MIFLGVLYIYFDQVPLVEVEYAVGSYRYLREYAGYKVVPASYVGSEDFAKSLFDCHQVFMQCFLFDIMFYSIWLIYYNFNIVDCIYYSCKCDMPLHFLRVCPFLFIGVRCSHMQINGGIPILEDSLRDCYSPYLGLENNVLTVDGAPVT